MRRRFCRGACGSTHPLKRSRLTAKLPRPQGLLIGDLMATGTILLVHGTGVRFAGSEKNLEIAQATAGGCSVDRPLVGCDWGDPFGVEFKGLSLPDAPLDEDADFAQWIWILDDPLLELSMLTIPDSPTRIKSLFTKSEGTSRPEGFALAQVYKPTLEFEQLLSRGGLTDVWPPARARILSDPVTRRAFDASMHELHEAFRALARGLVAQMHIEAASRSRSGPSAELREKLVQRLLQDWNQQVFGVKDTFIRFVSRAATRYVRGRRSALNATAALPLGDVLLYQSKGNEIRAFIRKKIESCDAPVAVVAHSLGGIACVDLLARESIPGVDTLVTLGSQSSFMHEIGALASLNPGEKLRPDFPRWLNVYDRNDFLSFFASRIFPNAADFEVSSGQPFPESHSAYFGNEVVWTTIRSFLRSEAQWAK